MPTNIKYKIYKNKVYNLNGSKLNYVNPFIGVNEENYDKIDEKRLSLINDSLNDMGVDLRSLINDSLPAQGGNVYSGIPVRFLAEFAKGIVMNQQAKITYKELMPVLINGSFATDQIVQIFGQFTATTDSYKDGRQKISNQLRTLPVTRDVAVIYTGFDVNARQQEQMQSLGVGYSNQLMAGTMYALENAKNQISFYGYGNGANQSSIYGILNDPNLPPYLTPSSGSGATTKWVDKTFLEIVLDITTLINSVISSSSGNVDFNKGSNRETKGILAISPETLTVLNGKLNNLGTQNVTDFIKSKYNIEIITAPQFSKANSNDDVAYLYAEEVIDQTSTDDRSVFATYITSPLKAFPASVLGSKTVYEFACGTSGVMAKRPYGVGRMTGVN